ncbi:MAG: spore coat protein U domain-containing protein [Terracidiphilus sp.]|jgi:spore coat protein U-like protein
MMRRFGSMLLLMLAFGSWRAAALPCSLSISTLNFGTYSGALLNGTGTGKITCQSGADGWDIVMYTGAGAGATETTRYMTGPNGVELGYKLFTDAARTNNWGDTTGNELSGSGTTSFTVYGQVTAGQVVPPGTYTDTMNTATTTFSVTVIIAKACSISATNMAFGTYTRTLVQSTSTISVNCTDLTPYNVGLNAGVATGATVTNRSMTGPGSALLKYQLFSNSGYTTNWGNTVGTDTVAGTGNGATQPLTVYGQIPALELTAQGSYTDTITVTITY